MQPVTIEDADYPEDEIEVRLEQLGDERRFRVEVSQVRTYMVEKNPVVAIVWLDRAGVERLRDACEEFLGRKP